MKFLVRFFVALLLLTPAFAQTPKPVTVPITLDHNRIVIDVYLPLPDGTSKRVRAWVNTGSTWMNYENAELLMSPRIASLFGSVKCDAKTCTATPPLELSIGAIKISLAGKTGRVPVGVPQDVIVPGMGPEIDLPSTILSHYDILIDYPNRQLTLASPGTLHFEGTAVPWSTALPVTIGGKRYMFGLDLGLSASFVSDDLFSGWIKEHPDWPHMSAAVGSASSGLGLPDEAVVLLPSVSLGQVELKGVLATTYPTEMFETGVLGADALQNFQVGLDYTNSRLYLKRLSTYQRPGTDVVGLVLRAESDGRYTILRVADYHGQPSVPDLKAGDVLVGVDGAPATGATLGQVWSLLGGTPGQMRTLALERDGKRFTIEAPVRRFLDAKNSPTRSPRRNPHRRN